MKPRHRAGIGAMEARDMTEVSPFPHSPTIEAEACAWVARLDGSKPSQETLAAFREWINRSPQHRAEMTRLAGLWSDLNVLTELSVPHQKIVHLTRYKAFKRAAIVAACAVLIAVTMILRSPPTNSPITPSPVYSTRVGEQQSIVLADDTKILLNTDSSIRVSYSLQQRDICLLHGEAYFQVAHNAARPFLVHAGTSVVRAVGTAFSVYLQKRDVEVDVTEGTVEVSSVANPGMTSASSSQTSRAIRLTNLNAGQRAAFNPEAESIQSVKPPEMDRRLSWREGILTFSGEPLDQVVEEVSRYTPVKIVISDPAIRNLRIGGYFKVGETDTMLEALETTFGVRVNRVNDRLVYLAAKK